MLTKRFDDDVEALADRLHLKAEMLNRYKTQRPRMTVAGVVYSMVTFVSVAVAVFIMVLT